MGQKYYPLFHLFTSIEWPRRRSISISCDLGHLSTGIRNQLFSRWHAACIFQFIHSHQLFFPGDLIRYFTFRSAVHHFLLFDRKASSLNSILANRPTHQLELVYSRAFQPTFIPAPSLMQDLKPEPELFPDLHPRMNTLSSMLAREEIQQFHSFYSFGR